MEQTSRFAPERQVPEPASPPRCQGCGGENGFKAFESLEPGFHLLRCPDCGLARTWPAVPPEKIAEWYTETYYGKENVRFNPFFEYLTRLFRRRRAAVLHNRIPRGPVLDVGCGRGFILNYLRSLGYEAHGMEFSPTAAWHAANVLKLDVSTGDFLASPHKKDHFHAVIFWHSLEHFHNPVEALSRARQLLKPGGLLAVAVPNIDSLQARLFGRHWFHLDIPRHYFHFGAKSLEAVLTRQHFRIVQLDHFSFEQNPYGWIQSFYNALGFPPSFLYEILKDRSARRLRLRRHPMTALLTLLLLAPITALSFILTLWETLLRQGGTIEVYAIKE
jgi:2-polyprenyl-3-methyl-5-hydroxy-6-metoxy-1,4-benzoquinol methylase